MVHFFRRGDQKLSAETRLNPNGPGYELVISEDAVEHIESFETLPQLLAREHELLLAWRAQGWRDMGQPARPRSDTWRGPR